MLACGSSSPAKRRYERDVLRLMAGYLIAVYAVAWFVRHGHVRGWHAYFFSMLPAVLIIALLARMGTYLGEEKDEYQRLLTIRAILVGTAALLGMLVVNDFVRAFAGAAAIPPFVGFVVFMVAMGITQLVQWAQNRGVRE